MRFVHNTQHDADRCHPRRRRLRGPGDARPRARAIPELELVALGSDSLAGQPALGARRRGLNGSLPRVRRRTTRRLASGADVVFLCLGNERGRRVRAARPTRVVVDLSGAHRLADAALYAEWYGFEHPRPGAVELRRCPSSSPPTGRLIANPGCYATAALLALAPLATRSTRRASSSTRSRACPAPAATLKASSHAGFVLENLSPYAVGAHQHAPEIAQALGFPVCFVPHLLPCAAACSRPVTSDARRRRCARCSRTAYAASPVVRVLPEGVDAGARARAAHRRRRDRRLRGRARPARAIVICAIDNLGKGAAGQAVQNANLALGLDETLGLRLDGVLV